MLWAHACLCVGLLLGLIYPSSTTTQPPTLTHQCNNCAIVQDGTAEDMRCGFWTGTILLCRPFNSSNSETCDDPYIPCGYIDQYDPCHNCAAGTSGTCQSMSDSHCLPFVRHVHNQTKWTCTTGFRLCDDTTQTTTYTVSLTSTLTTSLTSSLTSTATSTHTTSNTQIELCHDCLFGSSGPCKGQCGICEDYEDTATKSCASTYHRCLDTGTDDVFELCTDCSICSVGPCKHRVNNQCLPFNESGQCPQEFYKCFSTSTTTNQPTQEPTTTEPTIHPSQEPTSVQSLQLSTTAPSSISTTSEPSANPTTSYPSLLPPITAPSTVPTASVPTWSESPTISPSTSTPTISPLRLCHEAEDPGICGFYTLDSCNESIGYQLGVLSDLCPAMCGQCAPTESPSTQPTTSLPTFQPSFLPSVSPSLTPTKLPTSSVPSFAPSDIPSSTEPTLLPTTSPTSTPTRSPTLFSMRPNRSALRCIQGSVPDFDDVVASNIDECYVQRTNLIDLLNSCAEASVINPLMHILIDCRSDCTDCAATLRTNNETVDALNHVIDIFLLQPNVAHTFYQYLDPLSAAEHGFKNLGGFLRSASAGCSDTVELINTLMDAFADPIGVFNNCRLGAFRCLQDGSFSHGILGAVAEVGINDHVDSLNSAISLCSPSVLGFDIPVDFEFKNEYVGEGARDTYLKSTGPNRSVAAQALLQFVYYYTTAVGRHQLFPELFYDPETNFILTSDFGASCTLLTQQLDNAIFEFNMGAFYCDSQMSRRSLLVYGANLNNLTQSEASHLKSLVKHNFASKVGINDDNIFSTSSTSQPTLFVVQLEILDTPINLLKLGNLTLGKDDVLFTVSMQDKKYSVVLMNKAKAESIQTNKSGISVRVVISVILTVVLVASAVLVILLKLRRGSSRIHPSV